MPPLPKRVWARRHFDYAGRELDRGQVYELVGARNDEKLVRLGFVAEVERKAETWQCSECGAEFVGEAERQGHGQKRHRARVFTPDPDQEDQRAEREERLLDEVAPFYLDKTTASQRS